MTRRPFRPALVRPALVGAVLSAALVLTGCSGEAPPDDTAAAATTDTLGVDEFAAAAEQPGAVLIDVRTPAEFAEGHLEGAANLDVSSPDFAAGVAELPTDGTYVVYCRSGNRSAQALELMRAQGITDVVHLDGGIGAWTGAGRPVVTGS